MKKAYILIIISFFAFISCKNGKKEATVELKRYELNKTIEFRFGDENRKIGMNFFFDLLDVTGSDKEFNNLILQCLYNGLNAEQYADSIFRSYIELWGIEYAEIDADEYDWESFEIVSAEKIAATPICLFSREHYDFTGGAHGNESMIYFVFDTKEKKKLELTDIFPESSMKELSILIEQQIRKQYEIEENIPLSEYLFEDHITAPSKNFYLTEEGIGFYWNEYEIAPYSAGPVDVEISYSDLLSLMTENGKTLFMEKATTTEMKTKEEIVS